MTYNWQGHRIADAKHADALNQEYGHRASMGIPADMAARGAYEDYRRGIHHEAAAYHLRSAQNASQDGHRDSAARHQAMYRMHTAAAGHRGAPTVVPHEIQARLHSVVPNGTPYFVGHAGDKLLGG